jgi:hypothetical protein
MTTAPSTTRTRQTVDVVETGERTPKRRRAPWFPGAAVALWIAVAVVVGAGLDTLRTDDGPLVGTGPALEIVWIAAALALAIPSAISLTLARALTPLAPIVAVAIALERTDATTVGGIALSLVATLAVWSSPIGSHHLQAGAYGAERRFPLRPPTGYVVASALAWCLTVGLGIVAARAEATTTTAITGVLAIVLALASAPRWHRLSRRWLVLVPTGIVVHDPLVLAETLMLRRSEVATLAIATDNSPADLTGGVTGPTLELATVDSVTAVLATGPRRPGGQAIHLNAARVAPTRPGAVLRAWSQRRATPPPSTQRSSRS